MSFANEWGAAYNQAVRAFTRAKRGLIPALEDVAGGTSRLALSLAALDATNPETEPGEQNEKRHKAFVAEQKNLEKVAAKYAILVDRAIAATDKTHHADVYRELKLLRKQLDLVVAKVKAHSVRLSKAYIKTATKITTKVGATRDALREQGVGDVEIDQELNYLRQKYMAANWDTATKKSYATAAVALQKIKANPTPQTYNAEMDRGGRDVTQQMVNLIKLVQDGKCPSRLVREMQGLADFRNALAQFGNGEKRRVAEDASRAEVLAQAKEYDLLVKSTKPFYDKMTKFLAKHKL